MCVVAFAWQPNGWDTGGPSHSPGPELVVMANRDEFHQRPTAALDIIDEHRLMVGGRDLEKQGGWLWARADGKLAAVTNVRNGGLPPAEALQSRGQLVASFVAGPEPVRDYASQLAGEAHHYGRFNLILYDGTSLGYASNTPTFRARLLDPGVYSLSNATLDTPWPKAVRLRNALVGWLTSAAAAGRDLEPLFGALGDDQPVADAELPDTGVGLTTERLLAPPFIRSSAYGTRCSSVVVFNRDELMFAERRFGPDGDCTGETSVTIPRGYRAAG
jgi:uncharacterized protein with NRDE domain